MVVPDCGSLEDLNERILRHLGKKAPWVLPRRIVEDAGSRPEALKRISRAGEKAFHAAVRETPPNDVGEKDAG